MAVFGILLLKNEPGRGKFRQKVLKKEDSTGFWSE